MSKLNTTNPENLIYQHGLLTINILGGIRLDGLDRMRTTLKLVQSGVEGIEVEHTSKLLLSQNVLSTGPALRHNLDLYNDNQVEKLIRKVAVKLEIGTSVTAAALSDLTNELEAYRLQELESQKSESVKVKSLNTKERKAAEQYLQAPNLIERTKEDIGRSGVIGEENNRLLMYIIFTSRKREQPLHIVSLGASGTGKTHLQEKVGELIPEEDKIEITSLSENAFYYFGQNQLQNKLILIEDLDGLTGSGANNGAFYALRELQSKKKISKTVVHKTTKGETKTIHLHVEGPVSVAGCTTKEDIYEDNANRSFLIYLNESEEQDEQIMQYQRRASAGKIDKYEEQKIKENFKNCQRILQPIKVVNPFAEQLKIPQEVFKPRRTNNHYLQFIEAVTFYHQCQRHQQLDVDTGEIYIETTLEDIEIANSLLKEILLSKSDELSGACRKYFEVLKAHLEKEKKTAFTNTETRKTLRVNHSNQKRYMIELQQCGFIKKSTGNKKEGFAYEVVSMEEYEQLQQGISNVLDKVLQEVQSSEEVHRLNEPLKPNNTKRNNKKFKSSQEV